jgi:RNA polymerase sigma-70 factor (ECF subfamily)
MFVNEEKIVKQILQKDERALLFFYRTHHASVLRYVHRQVGHTGIAEELTQDCFLDFIEGLRNFRGESSLKTYLFSIARYKVIDHIKKKKIKKILFSALPKSVVENMASVFMDDQLEQKELAQKIEKTISLLPNDYRLILRLKYMDGRRIKEIARVLALTFKAAESLLYRARQAFIRTYSTV